MPTDSSPCSCWVIGAPGTGKTTLSRALVAGLADSDAKNWVIIDGDDVRRELSADLGFSDADRCEQTRRVGGVNALLLRQGFSVINALIAPMDDARNAVYEQLGGIGSVFGVLLTADPRVLAQRRPAAHLRQGPLPSSSESVPSLVLDTSNESVSRCLERILSHLNGACDQN